MKVSHATVLSSLVLWRSSHHEARVVSLGYWGAARRPHGSRNRRQDDKHTSRRLTNKQDREQWHAVVNRKDPRWGNPQRKHEPVHCHLTGMDAQAQQQQFTAQHKDNQVVTASQVGRLGVSDCPKNHVCRPQNAKDSKIGVCVHPDDSSSPLQRRRRHLTGTPPSSYSYTATQILDTICGPVTGAYYADACDCSTVDQYSQKGTMYCYPQDCVGVVYIFEGDDTYEQESWSTCPAQDLCEDQECDCAQYNVTTGAGVVTCNQPCGSATMEFDDSEYAAVQETYCGYSPYGHFCYSYSDQTGYSCPTLNGQACACTMKQCGSTGNMAIAFACSINPTNNATFSGSFCQEDAVSLSVLGCPESLIQEQCSGDHDSASDCDCSALDSIVCTQSSCPHENSFMSYHFDEMAGTWSYEHCTYRGSNFVCVHGPSTVHFDDEECPVTLNDDPCQDECLPVTCSSSSSSRGHVFSCGSNIQGNTCDLWIEDDDGDDCSTFFLETPSPTATPSTMPSDLPSLVPSSGPTALPTNLPSSLATSDADLGLSSGTTESDGPEKTDAPTSASSLATMPGSTSILSSAFAFLCSWALEEIICM